jgi:acyl-coenzyme A thioesterase PaaI-like protein
LILGHCEVLRQGRSLIFVRCTLSVNGNHVLNSSGVVKRIPKPA